MYKVSNDDVLKKVDEDKSILNGIWKSIHRWFGHVLRYDRFCKRLLKDECWGKRPELEGE